jgi:hypothetical protein
VVLLQNSAGGDDYIMDVVQVEMLRQILLEHEYIYIPNYAGSTNKSLS